MNNIRILHINTSDVGGAAIACIRVHNKLLDHGIDSKLLTLFKSRTDIKEHFSYYELAKINMFEKFILKLKERNYYKKYFKIKQSRVQNNYEIFSYVDPISLYRILDLDIFKHADIIHLNWINNFTSLDQILKSSKSIVWTMHDMNPFTGGCHHSDNCCEFKRACNLCPQLLNKSISVTNLKRKRNAILSSRGANVAIISPSQWMLNRAASSSLFKEFIHYKIPHGINAEQFIAYDKKLARDYHNIPHDKKVILFVAENVKNPRKGLKFLLEAIKKFDLEKEIVVCSIGKEYIDNVINLGYITDTKSLAMAYSAADLLVLPSVAESFSNVTIESFLCGTPVVAFPAGGVEELIISGTNGYLCNKIDAEDLADTIDLFLKNASTFNREQIRKTAAEKYNISHTINDYISVYREVLKQ